MCVCVGGGGWYGVLFRGGVNDRKLAGSEKSRKFSDANIGRFAFYSTREWSRIDCLRNDVMRT